jgi:3-oxoacyl-[acyl-carrier protein] reductase
VDLGLTGATSVVTGGSKGMGRAVAEVLAAEGANVAVLARGQAELDATVQRLTELGSPDAVGLSVDFTDPAAITGAFLELQARWGSLNTLIHTLGPSDGHFADLDDEGWQTALDLGLMAGVRCIRAALPLLRAAEWGRIVTFAAHSIQRQSPRLTAYTASKAALWSVTKNLAKTLGPEGILVNCISPGSIVTAAFTENLAPILAAEGLDASDPVDVMTWISSTFHQPADLGRAGLPDEVATAAVYLGSRRNGYVTGANINVDGGSDFI